MERRWHTPGTSEMGRLKLERRRLTRLANPEITQSSLSLKTSTGTRTQRLHQSRLIRGPRMRRSLFPRLLVMLIPRSRSMGADRVTLTGPRSRTSGRSVTAQPQPEKPRRTRTRLLVLTRLNWTVTDAYGNSDIATTSITVESRNPDASFTTDSTTGNADTTFAFDGAGSSDPDGSTLTYEWAFGDGATTTGETTSHSYADPVTTPLS